MSQTGWVIALSYGAVTLLAIALAVWLWLTTWRPLQADRETLAHREKLWLVAVAVSLAALLAATIVFIPYDDEAKAGDAQVVDVTASQFFWRFSPQEVRAGQQVEFVLRSTDVNHNFALYDEDELLFQVQVVPEYTHRVPYTFDRSGTYKVLCLEFCGVGHHRMFGEIRVVE